MNGISTEEFAVTDTKIYAAYLTEKGSDGKILLYLKNKFSIPLSEIKTFSSHPRILLVKGTLIIVMKEKEEVEKMGGKVELEIIV